MIDIDALDTTEAATLPIKTQWRLVHYWRDTGQFERAHALIDEHVGRNGQTITNVMERARVAQAEGDTVAALRYARERYGLRASVPATNALIRAEIAAGNLARARDLISELEKSGAEGPSVLRLRAEIERRAGNLDLAESLLRRSVHSDYSSPDTYLGLAAVALALGDIAAAREHLDLLLTDPATLDYRHQREAGLLFEQMGDTDRASQLRDQANEALRSVKEQLGREVDSRLGAFVTLGDDAVDFSDAIVDANESSGPELDSTIVAPLKQVFGFDGLRPGQASVISRVMSAIDTLAIMPTGSGKSLTFQLPALLLPGVTIVISPLIALMKDQVDSLPEELRRRTRLINSTLSPDEMERALDELISGALKLVYVAPERLRDRAFLQAIRQTHVSLAVIDEAHCISLWGQDFRPDYLFIPRAVKEMGEPPVLAVTATATPDMARHIAEALRRTMDLCRVSLFRPNLFYEVRQAGSREFKIREMVDICRNLEGSGIVYVNSRKDTESFAAILRSNGVNALHYHAGLEPGLRASHQDRFMSGQVRVVVATIAFGMGVDKANVRFIIHFNPPASLEAYAQESGRAGRDGEIARCILLATRTDETRLKTFSRQDVVTKDDLRVVYTNLKRRATGRWVLLDRNDANRLAGDAHEGV
ncbi:MAG: RecQ family ATP-dependent DNA helicase, partial [Thermomicrobiales bacterium]